MTSSRASRRAVECLPRPLPLRPVTPSVDVRALRMRTHCNQVLGARVMDFVQKYASSMGSEPFLCGALARTLILILILNLSSLQACRTGALHSEVLRGCVAGGSWTMSSQRVVGKTFFATRWAFFSRPLSYQSLLRRAVISGHRAGS